MDFFFFIVDRQTKQSQSVNIRFLHLNSITKLLTEELKKTKASVISNEAFFLRWSVIL